jgi:BASS family bile acid:Na+ symporter
VFLQKIFQKLSDSYFVIVIFSLLVGVIFSEQAIALAPHVTIFLGIIFFLSSLKIEMRDIFAYLNDKRMLFVVNVFMLLVLPALVYYATLSLFPLLAIAFLILAAMPSGMTTPLLSELSGGKQNLALVFTVSTSLLAPVTVPLMIKLLAGTAVAVSFSSMFISLAKVIFIPFILAQIIKRFTEKGIEKVKFIFKPTSVILLALLIIGIVAKQADSIIEGLRGGESLIYLALLFALFVVFHIVGYFTAFWREREDRITITVCITYMNFTLAIYLVDQFFTEPNIIVPVILSVIPWALLLMPFKWITRRTLLI